MPEAETQSREVPTQEVHKILRELRGPGVVPGTRLEVTLYEGITLGFGEGASVRPYSFVRDKKSDNPADASYMGRVVELGLNSILFVPGWKNKEERPDNGNVGNWEVAYGAVHSWKVLVERNERESEEEYGCR